MGGELLCLLVEFLRQRVGKRGHGALQVDQGRCEVASRFGQPLDQRLAIGFERVAAAVLLRPCQHLLADEAEEMLGRAFRLARLHAARPAGTGEIEACAQHLLQQLLGLLVFAQEIADAVGEPAAPPALGLGAAQPAAKLGGFECGEVAREGAVSRIKEVMALVEDDAADAAGGASSSSVCATPRAWSTAA